MLTTLERARSLPKPPVRLAGVGMVEELRRGVPSYITDDLVATDIEFSRDEVRERMSGNLCRCGAYNGIVEAISDVYAEQGA